MTFSVVASHVHQGAAKDEGNVGNEHRGFALLSPEAALIDLDHMGRLHIEQLLHGLLFEHHGPLWLLYHEVCVLRWAYVAEELCQGADPIGDFSVAAFF